MKSKKFVEEISKLTTAELQEKARVTAEELMKLRFRKTSGQLQQTHHMGQLRKNLARIQTQISVLAKNESAKTAA